MWEKPTVNQRLATLELRQRLLFWIGLGLLVLWALPHPHQGVYVLTGAEGVVRGGFRHITFFRGLAALVAWGCLAFYAAAPAYVRWMWPRWHPLGE